MQLDWLELRDFRCYPELRFEPDPGSNLLIGDNGAGKTTVLEAVGYLSSLRSFRGSPDQALIRDGADRAVLRGEFSRSEGTVLVEVELPAEGRRAYRLNGKRPPSRAAVAAEVALVAFLPDDLDLVKRGPAYRRGYLDDLLVRLWPAAAADLGEHEKAVRQRNALLRQDGRDADVVTLDVWDERLAALGAAVLRRRLDALALLGPRLTDLVSELDGGYTGPVSWRYESSGPGALDPDASQEDLVGLLAEAQAQARRRDLERRITTVGPHRDELVLLLDGRELRTRASQGEQRSTALGLRVVAYELIGEARRGAPVLVLDDVFSELDPERSRRLVARLPAAQVFVSSARAEDVPVSGRRWRVADGKVGEMPDG